MSGEMEFKKNYLLSRGDSANQSINVVVVVIVVDIYCFSSKPRISLLWSRCSSILHMYCHIGILKYTYQSLGSKTVFQASTWTLSRDCVVPFFLQTSALDTSSKGHSSFKFSSFFAEKVRKLNNPNSAKFEQVSDSVAFRKRNTKPRNTDHLRFICTVHS